MKQVRQNNCSLLKVYFESLFKLLLLRPHHHQSIDRFVWKGSNRSNKLSNLREIEKFELSPATRKKTCSVNFESSLEQFGLFWSEKETLYNWARVVPGAQENGPMAADHSTDDAGVNVNSDISSLWMDYRVVVRINSFLEAITPTVYSTVSL